MMEIRNLFHKGGSLADLRYTEKERKSRLWEIAEKITCDEYALDWSQSKVFLVLRDFSIIFINFPSTAGILRHLICTKTVFGRRSAPDPAARTYNAPPDSIVGRGGRRPLDPSASIWALCFLPPPPPIQMPGYATTCHTHPVKIFWLCHWLHCQYCANKRGIIKSHFKMFMENTVCLI